MPTGMYSNEMTWDEWVSAISNSGNQLLSELQSAKALADKWNSMTYGLTAAQIAALPQFTGKVAADATAMMYAIGVFTDLYNAMNNVAALTQANREGYLVPFI